LAVTAESTVFVADYDHHRDWSVTNEGQIDVILKSGLARSPSGVTIATGRVLVLEYRPESPAGIPAALGTGSYIRVRQTTPGGTAKIIAIVWGPNTGAAVASTSFIAVGLILVLIYRLRRR